MILYGRFRLAAAAGASLLLDHLSSATSAVWSHRHIARIRA
jgi:hypothetical protein